MEAVWEIRSRQEHAASHRVEGVRTAIGLITFMPMEGRLP
jgi:hypothetical protein